MGLTVAILGAAGCGPSLPRPPISAVATADYVAVPFAPRAAPVEYIPPSPAKDAVWIDGTWEWTGARYGWRFGTWVRPPEGVKHARWVVVRRKEDGQLFFAPSTWKDSAGQPVDDRTWRTALGPRARARTRLGSDRGAEAWEDRSELTSGPPDEDGE